MKAWAVQSRAVSHLNAVRGRSRFRVGLRKVFRIMWEELSIERDLEKALLEEFGEAAGKTLYGEYTAARSKLIKEVLEYIKSREPNLTDHGPRHIKDVLEQAHQIIPPSHLCAREQLMLLLAVFFHDTGNIHGRKGHEEKVADIYDFVRGKPLSAKQLEEKALLLAIVGTHGGVARDGKSKDTIADLNITEPFLHRPIRMREIAAIMRFADELAEGPQRTSEYLNRRHGFDIKSGQYHDYAAITSITIDSALERIAATYHIDVQTEEGRIADEDRLRRLIKFAYHRVIKLDEERQYAKYYSNGLALFKHTSATFRFFLDGQPVDPGLEPLVLTDIVVPGGSKRTIVDQNPEYSVDGVIHKLEMFCTDGNSNGRADD